MEREIPECPFRVGHGYDVHALAAGLPMRLGGVEIRGDCGFVAHSDGDVAIHALCDALLGSLALGDIGKHFPDTSDQWKDADSRTLLRQVAGLIGELGWKIGNADLTIALQQPKIGPYIEEMRRTLASVMGIPPECVSVKATTNEKLGFVGRSEGCQVWAVVLIYKA